ncbi:MAG: glycerophosphoryl diester phosphodiesterase, partial [Micromonosporaceae bacterium]
RLTSDRHLVCLHDRRLERTSNGRGPVSEHTLADLNALDFGSWYRQNRPKPGTGRDRPGEREAPASPPECGPGAARPGFPEPTDLPILDRPGCSGSAEDQILDRPGFPASTDDEILDRPGFPESTDDLILDRPDPTGPAQVLTLDRLLAAAAGARRPIRLLIETKHPTRFGAEVEERLVATLRRYGMHRPDPHGVSVAVMSFAMSAVRRVRELAPDLPTVLLLEFLPPWLRDGRLPSGARIAGPGLRLLRSRPWLADRIHRQGNQMYVWTVNDAADLDMVLALGADGIISDRPRFVLDHLGR